MLRDHGVNACSSWISPRPVISGPSKPTVAENGLLFTPLFPSPKLPASHSRSVSKHSWHLNFYQILRGVSLGQRACGGTPGSRSGKHSSRYAFRAQGARRQRALESYCPTCAFLFPQSQRERTCVTAPCAAACWVGWRGGGGGERAGRAKSLMICAKGPRDGVREVSLSPGEPAQSMHPPRRDRPCSSPLACPEVALRGRRWAGEGRARARALAYSCPPLLPNRHGVERTPIHRLLDGRFTPSGLQITSILGFLGEAFTSIVEQA